MAVEYAPPRRRGFYGAVPQVGALAGLALGSLATSAATAVFTPAQFQSFGWRIPFLLSVVLIITGLWIRGRVGETPSFAKVKAQETQVSVPIVETLKYHWRAVLITIGAKFVETSTFFIFATFTISYAVSALGFSETTALNAILISAIVAIPVMLYFGSLSDRVGRKNVYVGGAVAMFVFAIPYFWLLSFRTPTILVIALLIGFSVIWSAYGAVLGTMFAESFSANVRYTGVSLGYQVGAALVGGPAPLIATGLLIAYDNNYVPVGIFIMGCAAVSLIAMLFFRDRSAGELDAV